MGSGIATRRNRRPWRNQNEFLTEEQKAKLLAGNLEALLARFPA